MPKVKQTCLVALSFIASAIFLATACATDESAPEPCVYPQSSTPFGRIGDVIPALKWNATENGEPLSVDLEKFYCGEQFPGYESILFVLVAEWCPECPDYSRLVDSLAEGLEFHKSKVIFVDLETNDFELPTRESAEEYVSQYTDRFVRVGEGAGDPPGFITERGARYVDAHSLWDATPNAFFIRKSDMQLVVRQQDAFNLLPFTQIAQSLDADWSDPTENPPFVNNCENDEASEPNDDMASAQIIVPGDVISGGICNLADDYYRIEAPGAWRVDLEFTHWLGNLDAILVDPETGEDRTIGGRILGSTSTDDDEVVIDSGAALLRITSPSGQSAPYTLRLTALE